MGHPLDACDGTQIHAQPYSPSCFMSLGSPSSPQASNLMVHDSVTACGSSSSSGPGSPFQFCDTYFAAYPVQLP